MTKKPSRVRILMMPCKDSEDDDAAAYGAPQPS